MKGPPPFTMTGRLWRYGRLKICATGLQLPGFVFLLLCGPIISARASSLTLEAESGALGTDFAVSNGSPNYITILTDSAGTSPGSPARVATYSVNFPSAGTYQLYGRVRVGSGAFNDDSLFYANGFGAKSPTTSTDWVL